MNDHRKPPLPESWNDESGFCRWCGQVIIGLRGKNKGKVLYRRRWHSACVEQYKMIFWPDHTRFKLLEKRGKVCEDCGKEIAYRAGHYHGYWDREQDRYIRGPGTEAAEMHHIVPLSEYKHNPQDPYAAWREDNLVLLCHDCHVGPTGRHAQLRQEKDPQESFLYRKNKGISND